MIDFNPFPFQERCVNTVKEVRCLFSIFHPFTNKRVPEELESVRKVPAEVGEVGESTKRICVNVSERVVKA